MPIKVYELAKELRITNTEALNQLIKLGMRGLTPGSDLDDSSEAKLRSAVEGTNGVANGTAPNGASPSAPSPSPVAAAASPKPAAPTPRTATPSALKAAPAASPPPAPSGEVIEIPLNITIKELAERLRVGASEVQKVLMQMGVLAPLNQRLAPDAVQRIAQKLGRNVHIASPSATPAVEVPATKTTTPAATPNRPTVSRIATNRSGRAVQEVQRPPVVTIMGHVDHGKTTLLDTIRKASVADGEAGGITQHIGAYQVEHNGQRITFIDTPGHAAFSAMRARGASVTDIIIIVVAADDSIMPQTEEAITLAKEAKVPIIVAVNKVDLPDANPDRVLTDLTQYELVPEAFGGNIQTVNISAKKGEGIDDLLDTILLVSEVEVDPKADPHGKAQGTVIEAKQEKGRGAVVSVLVQQGTLTLGDIVVAGQQYGKIRTMSDDKGGKLSKAGPSTPVEIIGLNAVPEAGDRLEVAKDEREARALAQEREIALREERLGGGNRVTLEALYKQLLRGATKELNVVIKGDVQGSVQAVRDAIQDMGNDEVRVRVLSAAVGAVSENDVLLAASDKDAEEKNSLVLGFNVGLANGVEKRAEQEHVQIKTFSIIYELIDSVQEALIALLEPIYEESIIGKAEVRAKFKLPGGRSIAGCYVLDGVVRRNAKARLYRGKDLLFTGDVDTLKRFKDDAREVASGYECGMTLQGFNDITEGDIIECFEMREIPRTLD
jgi:translation initiation factor IF-2